MASLTLRHPTERRHPTETPQHNSPARRQHNHDAPAPYTAEAPAAAQEEEETQPVGLDLVNAPSDASTVATAVGQGKKKATANKPLEAKDWTNLLNTTNTPTNNAKWVKASSKALTTTDLAFAERLAAEGQRAAELRNAIAAMAVHVPAKILRTYRQKKVMANICKLIDALVNQSLPAGEMNVEKTYGELLLGELSSTHQIWKIMDNGHDNNKLDNLIQNVESARDEFNTEKTAMRSQVQAEMQKLVSLRSKHVATVVEIIRSKKFILNILSSKHHFAKSVSAIRIEIGNTQKLYEQLSDDTTADTRLRELDTQLREEMAKLVALESELKNLQSTLKSLLSAAVFLSERSTETLEDGWSAGGLADVVMRMLLVESDIATMADSDWVQSRFHQFAESEASSLAAAEDADDEEMVGSQAISFCL